MRAAIRRPASQGHLLLTALAFVLAAPSAALAQVGEIDIVAVSEDLGGGATWRFLISIEATESGSIPTSATVTPPTGPDIQLVGNSEDIEFNSAPFASFMLLQAVYPAGDYDFDIGGETVTLNWTPTAPAGTAGEPSLTITSPASGSIKQSSTPDVAYSLDCSNCRDINLELFDVATDGDLADFEAGLFGQMPGSLPNPILFSSLTQLGPLSVLPDEANEAELLCGLVTFANESFDGKSTQPDFTYISGALLAATSVFEVGPANSMFTVDEVLIEAAFENSVWNFFVEVEGQDMPTTALMTPPGRPAFALTAGDPGFDLEFVDIGFASFTDLQMDYPPGDYLFTIGDETVTLGWSPTAPAGASGDPSLTITSPMNGAVGVSSQPDTSFSFDCTNCNDLDFDLFDVATDGSAASFGFSELDVAPPGNFTNPILFSGLSQDSGATELPAGENEIELLIGLANFSMPSFDAPTTLPSFQYVEAGTVIEISTFTVPEPTVALVHGIALGTLAALARRRRRR